VVPIQAHLRIGLEELKRALDRAVKTTATAPPSPFPEPFQREVTQLHQWMAAQRRTDFQSVRQASHSERSEESRGRREALRSAQGDSEVPRYLVERLLLDVGGYLENREFEDPPLREQVQAARDRLKQAGLTVPAVEAMSRYAWIGQVVAGVVTRPALRPV